MCSNTESCTQRISGCFVQYCKYFCFQSMSVIVAVCVFQELVSRPIVTARLGHKRNHILHLVLHEGGLHQMATWLLQNSIAGCRAVDFVCHFDLSSYTQFATVDVDALPHLLFMLFSVAVLTVTGLFYDIGGLIIFLSTLSIDVRFSLFHSSHITSSHNGYGILILFPGSFLSLSSVLTCGVFLHSFPFCTCADNSSI